MTMQYRLIDKKSGLMAVVDPSDGSVIQDYKAKALALVVEVFESHGLPIKNNGAGIIPEIISYETASRIGKLANALDQCRYWMEIQRPPDDCEAAKHWDSLIQEATDALED